MVIDRLRSLGLSWDSARLDHGFLDHAALSAHAWKDVILVGVSQLHDVSNKLDLFAVAHVFGLRLSGTVGNGWARLLSEVPGKETDILEPVFHRNALLAFTWVLRMSRWLPD